MENLEELAQEAQYLKEHADFLKLADQASKQLRRVRAPLLKISDYNKPGRTEKITKKIRYYGVIPDMKIVLIDKIPRIYSRYPLKN